MAFWRICIRGTSVTLQYRKSVFADSDAEPCGEGPASLVPDVEGFAIDSSEPWDLIQTAQGHLFARLSSPAREVVTS